MFNNEENKKLDWMYKGANSLVDREDYLLGRTVDKTLEHLNAEEKQKELGPAPPAKNHVEHECIPPSIRDYKLQQQLAEQVDLQAKLQEDPLLTIKKREEETRRQFLQNPVQLKKLQKALNKQKKQENRKNKDDLNEKLINKLQGKKSKKGKDKNLDIILMHKFNALKAKLSDKDLKDIMDGNESDSDNSESDDSAIEHRKESQKRHKKMKKVKKSKKSKQSEDSSEESSQNERKKPHFSERKDHFGAGSSDSDEDRSKRLKNFGLVRSDGTKIPLNQSYKHQTNNQTKSRRSNSDKSTVKKEHHKVHLTEEEKERRRREMMQNGAEREIQRAESYHRYKETEKSGLEQNFDKEFARKELLKATNSSTVESRIRSNLNNIQRTGRHMDKHFSRRH